MDKQNPESDIFLNSKLVQEYREKLAKNVKLPGPLSKWIEALQKKSVFEVRRLLKEERNNLPTKYKRLYRDTDKKLLLLIHYMRTQYPLFSKEEVKESTRFIETEQIKADGGEHPLMEKKLF